MATKLLGPNATLKALTTWLTATCDAATADQGPSDVVITFAGHGTQIALSESQVQQNPHDEPDDHANETWALFDQLLPDDDLKQLFVPFSERTDIVVVSDSCHSHTVIELVESELRRLIRLGTLVPRDLGREATETMLEMVGGISERRAVTRVGIRARVLGLGACKDDQQAYEDGVNDDGTTGHGHFTQAVLEAFEGGFYGSYEDLMQLAAARLKWQTPSSYWYGYAADLLRVRAFEPRPQ